MSFIVAIDGPAGTGKGTVTEILSKKMKLVNIDTGATYRCVTLAMINANVALNEIDKIKEILNNIRIELRNENGGQAVILNGEVVTEKIRSKEVTSLVSQVSSIKEVRLAMAGLQRKMAEGKNVIMEGRDIGTYVFPNADVKIYLDANVEERAKRRFKQNQEKGIDMTYSEILESIKKRDENDKNKEIGALKVASDAIVIDTTYMTIPEVVKTIQEIVQKKKKEVDLQEKIYRVRPDTKWHRIQRKIIKTICSAIYHVVYRVKVTGKVPDQGSYIICANHVSYLDAAGVVIVNKRKVSFVAKEDLFYNPFLNWFLHIFDIIPIKRNMQDMEAMKRCLKMLKSGDLLGIFPEGTRKGLEKNVKLKNGAAYMAIKTGVPVIPCGIKGTFKPFSRVNINFGDPIDFSKYKGQDKEKIDEATQIIMDNIIMLTNKEI